MHAGQLLDRLRRRYAPPTYALFAEVGDATATRSRSADAMVMGLWPSRGLELQGFEIKVDRRDWLRELKVPEKAETICRFCDRWWIVASDEKIVAEDELPSTWGLLVPRGDDLFVKRAAPQLEPVAMTRRFLAALMRAAHKVNPMELAVQEARAAGIEMGKKRAEIEFQYRNADADAKRLRESVEAFEKTSGLKIDNYNGDALGRAVALLYQFDRADGLRQFTSMRDSAKWLMEQIDRVIEQHANGEVPK